MWRVLGFTYSALRFSEFRTGLGILPGAEVLAFDNMFYL